MSDAAQQEGSSITKGSSEGHSFVKGTQDVRTFIEDAYICTFILCFYHVHRGKGERRMFDQFFIDFVSSDID